MTGTEIAVIGMAGRFLGAPNVKGYWENLCAGRESIRADGPDLDAAEQREQESKAHWVKMNNLIADVDLFDAGFFGYSPREAEAIDPQHRLFLECTWEAFEDAGLVVGDSVKHVGVFAGSSMSMYGFGQVSSDSHVLEMLPAIIANDKDYLATRASYKLNFSGPSITVQCACSTSLVAIHLACQSLVAGECDAAVAGGVSIAVPRLDRYLYLPGAMLSHDGRCRAFDANARGTAFAEGIGVVLLMRLEDALNENLPVHAVVLGSAVNNDATLKAGYTAPSIEGQAQVIRQAQAVAGVEASGITYVECHGTGTVLGDAVEIAALTRAFRSTTSAVGFCGVGSVKTNIGHLSTAAGVAGLIKTVLALKHGVIPASLNFDHANPELNLENSPFFVTRTLTPWRTEGEQRRRAGVSSFGIGGTNAHVVLEEPPQSRTSPSKRPWHVLPISARSEAALSRAVAGLTAHLEATSDIDFADVVYTQQMGRRQFEYRKVVVATDTDDAVRALRTAAADRVLSKRVAAEPRSVAFMFPGQGAQLVGMGMELYKTEPVFQEEVDRCLTSLAAEDVNLRPLLYEESPDHAGDRLEQTEVAQPALFVTEYALGRLLQSWGIQPDVMIGHSLGEYVAACLGGVLSLDQALHLVAERGRMMQAMPRGRMLSIALSSEELESFLGGEVSLAAINGPGQCVIAGTTEAIGEVERQLTEEAIPCRALRTSHAFHSFLMEPILQPFSRTAAQATVRAPVVPYASNVTGALVTEEQVADPTYWAEQIRQPVRFAQGIETLVARGATLFLEVGPGRTLSTLAKLCGVESRGVTVVPLMRDARREMSETFSLTKALAQMWLAGAVIDWPSLYRNEKRRRISLPSYPFERQSYWGEQRVPQAGSTPGKKAPVAEWFYAPIWNRVGLASQVAVTPVEAEGGHTLIFCDRLGVGVGLAAILRSNSANVVMIEQGAAVERLDAMRYVMDPERTGDYAEVLGLIGLSKTPIHVVHCWSLSDADESLPDATTFRPSQQRRLFSAVRILDALEQLNVGPVTFDIVSRRLFDVLGNERLEPQSATLQAFAKVIPQERQGVACRIFDIGEPHGALDSLARHLASKPDELALAFRNGHLWAQRFRPLDLERWVEAPPRLKEGGVYLIIGGLGRIALTLATYLAERWNARIVLTGRSAIPERADWPGYLERDDTDPAVCERIRSLRRIELAGGEVWVHQANAANLAEMTAVRAFIEERFGRLDGVVFGAGRVAMQQGVYQEAWVEECEAHFESKVHGLAVLSTVLMDVPLDFCVVLSSLSTVLGGLGHLAYSAANHAADTLIHQRSRTYADAWTTVNWDAWQFDDLYPDGVMKPALLRSAMTPAEGVQAFELILRMPPATRLVVSTTNLQSRIDEWINLRSVRGEEQPQAKTGHSRSDLDTPYAEPEAGLERRVADIWQTTLGIDKIGRDDDFFELGGHSLVAIQILSRLRQDFGIDFPIDRAFEAATVRKSALVIDELLQVEVQGLTDEEAEQLLKQADMGR
jgi:acyl transferase domain-containing protein/acyl carrier protein